MTNRRLAWLVGLLLAVLSMPGHAQTTWDYYFGSWLGSGPTYQPTTTFAHMSVSTVDSLAFNFRLSAYDPNGSGTLASAFGSSAFISRAIFNSVSGADPIGVSNVQTNGYVRDVFLSGNSANPGGVGFDFSDCFGGGGNCSHGGDSGRLQSGEWVSWTLSFAAPQSPFLGTPPVALHVQSFDINGVTSGWYTPTTPIPEPETYAMLLAGLGLLRLMARRGRRAVGNPEHPPTR